MNKLFSLLNFTFLVFVGNLCAMDTASNLDKIFPAGAFTWQCSTFPKTSVSFPIPAAQQAPEFTYEAVYYFTNQKEKNVSLGLKDVFKEENFYSDSIPSVPKELPSQLLKDGYSLFCDGKIKNLDSRGLARNLANRTWLGSRMIALAIVLGADPLLDKEQAQRALRWAWVCQNAKFVMLLLTKNVPIPG